MSKILNKEMRERIQNLSSLIRYNNKLHIRNENVAEHSFYVTLYTMELANILGLSDREYAYALEHAIIHDIHEIDTSDIPHNVKGKFSLIKSTTDEYEKDFCRTYFPDHFFSRTVLTRKDLVETVVLFADVLSVYQYALIEISLGNKTFEAVKYNAKARIVECASDIMRDESVSDVSKDEIFNLLSEIRIN